MEFHVQLKKLRKALDINQSQFGEIIGKSQGDVSELENAKQRPTKTLMVYLNYRYGDISTWGQVARPSRLKLMTLREEDDATYDHAERRIKQRRKREQRKDPAHQAPINLARLGELDNGLFLQTVGEINGRLWAAREARKYK